MCFKESDFALTKEQEEWVIGIMLSVTLVKLGLVLYCRSFTDEIVKAYALDHFFDVITNIIGLIAALLADYIADWMDPVGAIIVSFSLSKFFSFLYSIHQLIAEAKCLSNFFFHGTAIRACHMLVLFWSLNHIQLK